MLGEEDNSCCNVYIRKSWFHTSQSLLQGLSSLIYSGLSQREPATLDRSSLSRFWLLGLGLLSPSLPPDDPTLRWLWCRARCPLFGLQAQRKHLASPFIFRETCTLPQEGWLRMAYESWSRKNLKSRWDKGQGVRLPRETQAGVQTSAGEPPEPVQHHCPPPLSRPMELPTWGRVSLPPRRGASWLSDVKWAR